MTGTRVNDKSRRLIDNDQIIVFEENLQRDRLWQSRDLCQRWLNEFNLIASSNNLARPDSCIVKANKSFAGQLLEP